MIARNNKKRTNGRNYEMMVTTKILGIEIKAVGIPTDKNNTAMKNFIKSPYKIKCKKTGKESPTNLLMYFPCNSRTFKKTEQKAEKFCSKYRSEDYIVSIKTSKSSIKKEVTKRIK